MFETVSSSGNVIQMKAYAPATLGPAGEAPVEQAPVLAQPAAKAFGKQNRSQTNSKSDNFKNPRTLKSFNMQGTKEKTEFGLRPGAERFPLMVVISIIYPCNFGCPMCPYTDGNSEIRKFYRERGGDLFPRPLWDSIAKEAGPHGAWLRLTGGGEPMLHPQMVEMIEFAKAEGARIWLNTNGSMFGPSPRSREKLRRVIAAGTDLIEFSMDAGNAEDYAQLRPPRGGLTIPAEQWWKGQVDNVRAALQLRKEQQQKPG